MLPLVLATDYTTIIGVIAGAAIPGSVAAFFAYLASRRADAAKTKADEAAVASKANGEKQDAIKAAQDDAVQTMVAMGVDIKDAVAAVRKTGEDVGIFSTRVDGQMDKFRESLKELAEQTARADAAEEKVRTDKTASDLAAQTERDKQKALDDARAAAAALVAASPPVVEPVAPPEGALSAVIEATLHVPDQTINIDNKGRQ